MGSVSFEMEPGFHASRFSLHFNRLTYLGVWPNHILTSSSARKVYYVNRLICNCFLVCVMALELVDFYFVIGDLRKISFNLCTSVIVAGFISKMFLLNLKEKDINELRVCLWKDSLHLENPHDLEILDAAYDKLVFLRRLFYTACYVFLPVLLISSYFSYLWGPRELSFSFYLPMSDPLDDNDFVPRLLFEAAASSYVMTGVMEEELAFFSLVYQIDAHYQILINQIPNLNVIYGSDGDKLSLHRKEINIYLIKDNAKAFLKKIVLRHLQLIDYVEKVEEIYNRCMILQMFGVFVLLVTNGHEVFTHINEISVRVCFLINFIIFLCVNIIVISISYESLTLRCMEMGNAAFSTSWYKMDSEIRKSLQFIIRKCEKPTRLTAGKLFLVDLNAFLQLTKSVYSWLMLMRQLIK